MLLPKLDHGRQVFEIDLVDDAGPGRNHPKVAEGTLGELEQLIALVISLELELHVALVGVRRSEKIHLDRVVDHQVARDDRIDLVGVPLHLGHGITHGREVDYAGYAGEVLQHHAGRHEGDLALRGTGGIPAGQVPDMDVGNDPTPRETQRIFEQDADREGQTVEPPTPWRSRVGR
jgi:hypothetical protein